jgi:HD-GYP domain-containing protein (c-di-GMP phosphodiesterase class II)
MQRTGVGPWAVAGVAAGLGLAAGWYHGTRRRGRTADALHRTMVELLLNTLSAGDAYTERHSRRVADLTDVLAGAAGVPDAQRSTLRIAALLHDLGKLDDRFFVILHSERPLTPDERQEIEEHPSESAHILEPLEPFHPGLTSLVTSHHECWNGNGYPQGISGEAIPLGARLISLADVFDALSQPRSYREPIDAERVMVQLENASGTRFDPRLVGLATRPPVRDRWLEIARRGRAYEAREGAATESAS